MSRTTTIYAAAAIATLALAAGYSETSLAQAPAQAPAAQAPRQGRGGNAGDSAAPARKQGDGVGPFKKMVIRSVTLIDGTGGPPLSPMDIVIEGNRITVGASGRLARAAAAGRIASRAMPTSRSTARACT